MLTYNECYHGTSCDSYLAIKNGRKFTYYSRKNHWLGQGIYFFLEDKDKALWFVKKSSSPYLKSKEKCIIKVKINVEKDGLLNLDIEDGRKKLDQFAKFLKDTTRLRKRDGSLHNSDLRCLVIDAYIKYYNVKAVKYTFSNDKIVYQNLNLNNTDQDKIQNTGAQINVVDQSVINFDELSVECV